MASLAAIVNSSDDAIIGKDVNGVITSWNQGAERLFGYTAQEAVGQSITMLIPPDRLHEEADILARIKRHERIVHFDTVRVRKNRSLVDISLTISPIKDAAGRVVGASKIARNITERKRADETLRASEEKYRLVVEGATGFALIMLDLEGGVTSWNVGAERLLGYRDTEILGQDFSRFFTPEDQAAGKPRRELETAARREEGPDDNWLVRKDGSRFWASGATSALRDEKGRLRAFTKVIRDTTDRKRAAEALAQSHAELQAHAEELARFNSAAVGRELRMIDLKKEINELCERQGEPARYPLDFEEGS